MHTTFKEFSTNAQLIIGNENLLVDYKTPKQIKKYTFIITKKYPMEVLVDGVTVTLEPNSILSLTPIQTFALVRAENALVYQFNREFYCIKDHDHEVGCAGLLFFGNDQIPIIVLNEQQQASYTLLHKVFLEELENRDTIQAEMLRILMARFIIKTTRILKSTNSRNAPTKKNVDLLRNFNILVEEHFKKEHSVAYYAALLFKSPKTLSNSFAKLKTSPLKIIHARIIIEAKRLLLYSEKTTKEIAYEIGFEDASHLSRMFKKQTGISPSTFKLKSKNY